MRRLLSIDQFVGRIEEPSVRRFLDMYTKNMRSYEVFADIGNYQLIKRKPITRSEKLLYETLKKRVVEMCLKTLEKDYV